MPNIAEIATVSGWAYALIALLVVADALVPLIPAEAAVISGGALAAAGHLWLPGVLIATAVGAFAGDLLGYAAGRALGERLLGTMLRHRRSRGIVVWAVSWLTRRGPAVVVAARFVPGGRTASTLSAGFVRQPWRGFAVAAAVGATAWSGYAVMLGYAGGRAFANSLPLALLVAFAAAALVATVSVLSRRASRSAELERELTGPARPEPEPVPAEAHR